jgi:hypothetical protein
VHVRFLAQAQFVHFGLVRSAIRRSGARRILENVIHASLLRRSNARNRTAMKPSTPAPEVVLAATTVAVVRQIGHMSVS